MAAKTISFEMPREGYRRLMPFNRFYIERLDTIVVLHFALVNSSGLLLDRYSSAIYQIDLDMQKESLMEYLGKVGSLNDAPAVWQPPGGLFPVELFNNIGVTSNVNVAETTFNNIVVRAVTDLRQGKGGTIPISPLALLRSTQELQKHLIKELYPL